MQTIIRYLVNQQIPILIVDETTPTIRNKVVYSTPVKIYKNIDNTIELKFTNQDQKPVSVIGKTIKLYVIDQEEQLVVLSKTATSTDDGSTSHTLGMASVVIAAADTVALASGFYNFSVKLTSNADPTTDIIAYSDDNYGVSGQMHVIKGVYPAIDTVATDNTDEYDLGEIGNA